MTPEESRIIRSVFDRLKATGGNAPRDAEAEALVEALLKADPRAGVGLVQALVMTEQARAHAAGEAEALKQQLAAFQSQTPAPSGTPASGGLFAGPWGAAPQPQPQPQPGPWGTRPMQGGPWDNAQPQAQGGGFWGSALRTGAGVAGGLFAFEALRGIFGGHSGGFFGGGPTAGFFDQPTTVVNETVNVFQNDGTGGNAGGGLFDDGSSSFSDAGFDDGGGFGGGGDDWA